jgi:hypothetical protein
MPNEETNQPVEETPVQLGLNDLAILVQAVDIGAKNGAFAGKDMELVGAARNRVATFVNANSPKPETEEAPEETPEEAPEAE